MCYGLCVKDCVLRVMCGMNCMLWGMWYELCIMGYVLWAMWYELCVISFMLSCVLWVMSCVL